MCDFWHGIVSTRILDCRFGVEELSEFTAKINSCCVPAFQDIVGTWELLFDEEVFRKKLEWKAIEFEDCEEEWNMDLYDGGVVYSKGKCVLKESTNSRSVVYEALPECDDKREHKCRVISALIPKCSKVEHVKRNKFKVWHGDAENENLTWVYNLDSMRRMHLKTKQRSPIVLELELDDEYKR